MASWSYGQGNKASSASGTPSVSLTGVTVGDLLIVGVSAAATVTSLSDGHNTYTSLGNASPSAHVTLFYSVVTTGGSLTITAGASASNWAMGVAEFSPGGGTIATTGSNPTATGTSTAPATGNITISTPALVVGGFIAIAASSWSTSGNFTYDSNSGSNYAGGISYGYGMGYWLAANASPQDPALTLSSSVGWGGVGAAFTTTGGATSGGQTLLAGI